MRTQHQIHAAIGRAHRRRHGVALIMVLSIVAAAAILAWAMLASSAMRAQIDDNAVDAVEAVSLAESGASYAMHCLHYPDTVRPIGADPVGWFYPGQPGFKPWPDARGTADITVTRTGSNTYRIVSIASVTRGGSLGAARHKVQADVTTQLQGIVDAAGFNGAMTIPTNMRVVGPVVASGSIGNFNTQVTGSPPLVVASQDVVPPPARISLLQETAIPSAIAGSNSSEKTYTYDGATYVAEKAPTNISILGVTRRRPALNPCFVYWSDVDVTLNGASFTGVLVLQGSANLIVAGTNTITAPSGMPAIVANSKIELKSNALVAARLNVNGAAWVGDKISVNGTSPNRTAAAIKIDGALLMGGTVPRVDVAGTVDVTYTASAVAAVKRLSTVPKVSGVVIERWVSTD